MNDYDDDDAAIAGRVVSGDTEAFRSLVDRYSDRLYRFCRARLGDDSDAEDAVQDIFVRAFRSLRSYDPSRSWASWLFAIAANRVKSRYASRAAAAGLVERAGREALAVGDAASESSDPALIAVDALAAETLRAAVASLPTAYRAPVELYYFAGLGVSDVAKALGLGEEAVKTRLFRARKELSRSLEEKEQPRRLWKGRR
ncbi:MAG: RNA polymerase sigma factor [Spirochaetes bacterium]|nr:RNA polymerase sigma factor [Spirochaetota bacterium]MBU1080678.1 RNA polymerase sigma factor [Spirochaetota bacterium]